ncbi:MAG: (4Fe-4S)-binding protein [Bacteroidetes bacterium]|nr:(4Fe-4S)-binding protein [Bacteroidota bacterium]
MSNKVKKSELADFKEHPENAKEYSTGEITVFWRSELCIHSANCIMGLPGVFNTRKRPWININGGSTAEIIDAVNTCPSRALLYLKSPKYKLAKNRKHSKKTISKLTHISLLADGPYLVSGSFIIRDTNKKKVKASTDTVALCSCGKSRNKPFCDATHLKEVLHKD